MSFFPVFWKLLIQFQKQFHLWLSSPAVTNSLSMHQHHNTTSGQGITSSAGGEFTFLFTLSHHLLTEKQILLSNKWVTNMFPFREMTKLQYSTDYSRALNERGVGGQLSPPLVKLFANGMSKWTGAIFGILDVLLSMPKNSHTGQHKCQKQESLSWSRRQRGVTNHPQTRKQTGYDGPLNLLTFNLQMSTLWIIMLGCWSTNKKYLTVRVCVYWSNSECVIRILKKTDV